MKSEENSMKRIPSLAAAASILACCATGALATDSKVLKGQEAFTSWEADAPGVTRLITPADIPPPFATKDISNGPDKAARTDSDMPKVPDGFKVDLVASGIEGPRVIRVAPNGDLFVAASNANQVHVFRMGKESAKPEKHEIFASGLNQPYGIAFYPLDNPQWVYVANSDSVVRFPYKAGDLKAAGKPQTIISGIPSEHHWTRDIVFSPDGHTLYLSVGSGSNIAEPVTGLPEGGIEKWAANKPLGLMWGEEENRADVRAYNPDGKNMRVIATGIRNCSGLTIQKQTGDLWCVTNERDGLGDNVPSDYATTVKKGAFYGWPWYYLGDHEDPRAPLKGQRPDLAGKVTVPDVLFQAHSAPLNITFYEGDAFPAEYKGSAFVAMHGSWNRGNRTGYKVVRVLIDKDGKPTGEYQDFMTGFVRSQKAVWGRPVGVAVGNDGALYVTEDGGGTIWRVTYTAAKSP
jgi:glucose/arabinose dehydrogenase